MSDLMTTGFPAADTLDGSEVVGVVQGGADAQTTTQDIADLASVEVTDIESLELADDLDGSEESFLVQGGDPKQYTVDQMHEYAAKMNGISSKGWYRAPEDFNAFLTTATTTAFIGQRGGVITEISGASAAVTQGGLALDLPGVAICGCGTGASPARCVVYQLYNGLLFVAATKTFTFGARVQIPILSAAADQFEVRIGANNAIAATYPSDGVMFRAAHGDANWKCVNRRANVESVTDSGVALVAGAWYNLLVCYDATTGAVTYWINGSLVATITANLPTDSQPLFTQAGIWRGAAQTTNRNLYVKLFRYALKRNYAVEQLELQPA